MQITQGQLRAGRALLHIDQADLARRAGVAVVTVRRIEAGDGVPKASDATVERAKVALEAAGAEFIPNGVRRRSTDAERRERYETIMNISRRSAAKLVGHDTLTDDDLYDENGLPA
jgi:transcriptional regulator with XRE-family HTH domain